MIMKQIPALRYGMSAFTAQLGFKSFCDSCAITSTTNSSTMVWKPMGLKPLLVVHWQKIMAGGAEMWLEFAFMFEVCINKSVLIFPHTYFKLNLAFIFLPLSKRCLY